jgi:hypothetical protein
MASRIAVRAFVLVSSWLGELPVLFQGRDGIATYATLLGAAALAFPTPNTHQI